MNIIFGTAEAQSLSDKYIVLELDTITIRNSTPIKVYCVVEGMPLEDLSRAEAFKRLHADLMDNSHRRQWDYCLDAIEHLMGFWGKDVDTFYDVLKTRLLDYKEKEPDESWTGVIAK